MYIEAIGLTATIFVLISFLFKKSEAIRGVNIIGALLFVIYGILINSLSTWLLNGALILIHIFYLLRSEGNHNAKNHK